MVLLLSFGHANSNEITAILTLEAKNFSEWVMNVADHQNLPFIVIDKKEAKVFVFLPNGKLLGSTAALIGTAIGDDTAPNIGKKRISDIQPHERTTPAGRFIADLGFDPNKTEMLWIDYDSGVSMHIVVTGNAQERRLQRLSSKDKTQRRITYGCINVSKKFYQSVIQPTFKQSSGVVYILPEIHSIQKVFGADAARYSQR